MRAECREQVSKALGKRKLSAADSNRISSLYIRAQNTLARTDPDWMFKSPAERAEAIAQKTATDLAVQIAKNNQNLPGMPSSRLSYRTKSITILN